MIKRDFITVFAISLIGLLSLYISDFGLLQTPFILAFESYLLLLFFIGSILLKSIRHGFLAVFSALITVSVLAVIHLLSFPSYDAIAPVAYFAVLLFSFLLNLFILHGKFIQNKPLFKIYDDSKGALTTIVIATIFVGLFIASQELMEQFGLLTMVGAAFSYLIMLFYLSALIRLEKVLMPYEDMSKDEESVRNFVNKFGKNNDVHPFFASWLGTSVSKIGDHIDGIESKGHMGHNFFSAHIPFFWFSTILSFFMGVAFAGGQFLPSILSYLFIVVGVMCIAPQKFMKRSSRRFLGTFLVLGGFSWLYLNSLISFQFGIYSALLALISIYFAYRDDEFISMGFASFFVGSLFVLGHALWKPPAILTAFPWALTAMTFILLAYEYYARRMAERVY